MKPGNLIRLSLLLLLGLGILIGLQHQDLLAPEVLRGSLGRMGGWGPVVLVLIWLAAPILFIPGAPITLAAGFLFGPLLGALYCLLGATGGATLAFLLARYVGGSWIERRARGRLAQLKEGVEVEGWRFVAFVRLVPFFPFNLLNYALGLTRIPLRTYTLTSLVCMAPGAFGYAYLGYVGRETMLGGEGWVYKGMIALGVLATLILLPLMVRRWRSHRVGWLR